MDTNKTRNLNRLAYIEKCGQTWGQQKTTLPKENNLPHGEVKSESENPWEDDREGGGKNVS